MNNDFRPTSSLKNFLKALFPSKKSTPKVHFETSHHPYPDIIEFEGDDSIHEIEAA